MDNKISCCGMICSECSYYPESCAGCESIKGEAFWLEYTEEKVCQIYECCVIKNGLLHCGKCLELPCTRFDAGDPSKTQEENEEILKGQLRSLKENM